MRVDAIKNGIVIDHIEPGCAMKIYDMLSLDKLDCPVAILKNVSSNKMGKKDIIKIDCDIDINLDVLGFISPSITVVIVKNGEVAQKRHIELPEEVPGAPEGAYIFEVSPSTNMPKRVHGSNLQAGEYYIKFYDKNWSELTLDIFVDPALCNNGNDGLPAGTYTIADGSLDTYSNVALYNPYFGGNFTEAELYVSVDGDNYTFTLLGTAVSGATSKVIYMTYTGEINDMVK